MAFIASEQAEIESIIINALRDVSRANPYSLKAGLRILMTTDLQTFVSVCSTEVQQKLSDFITLLENPATIAPQSTKSEADRNEVAQFIKQVTLKNLHLLDNRTAILPNTYMVQKSIMEGERLKSVVHTSALRNIVTNANYFEMLEKKFKDEGKSADQIHVMIKKAVQSTENLHKAVREGNISEVLVSLAVHGVDINYPDELGLTPIHIATRAGLTETFKLLLTVP